MDTEIWSSGADLDIRPLREVSGDPILKSGDGGRPGIDDRDDDTFVDLEVEVGKISEEREELVMVVELDRVRKDSTNVISTKTSGAPICVISFLEGFGWNIKGDHPKCPAEGTTLVDARPLEEQKD